VDLIVAGKAAWPMAAAFRQATGFDLRQQLGVSMVPCPEDAGLRGWVGRHPVPDEASVAAGQAALAAATAAGSDDLVVLLLSGGASALLALPVEGVALADKQATIAQLLLAGADIDDLNAVRKHLSALKGGRLAAACPGRFLTLALSDVVGDDLSVIGSGPGVGDWTTFEMALGVLARCGGLSRYPAAVVAHLQRGVMGGVPESPRPDAAVLARADALVVGSRADAMEAAAVGATRLGYHVHRVGPPVVGEARAAAAALAGQIRAILARDRGPVCIVSGGETTVRVTGAGRGGRNQELALALALALQTPDVAGRLLALASVGTDGIDGPTDAAGAMADTTTTARAREAGAQTPGEALDDNNTYDFFRRLDDLVLTGPTATNVGDVQLVLAAPRN